MLYCLMISISHALSNWIYDSVLFLNLIMICLANIFLTLFVYILYFELVSTTVGGFLNFLFLTHYISDGIFFFTCNRIYLSIIKMWYDMIYIVYFMVFPWNCWKIKLDWEMKHAMTEWDTTVVRNLEIFIIVSMMRLVAHLFSVC
jgi:hypothetical protein